MARETTNDGKNSSVWSVEEDAELARLQVRVCCRRVTPVFSLQLLDAEWWQPCRATLQREWTVIYPSLTPVTLPKP
jgi:hypothetical protein